MKVTATHTHTRSQLRESHSDIWQMTTTYIYSQCVLNNAEVMDSEF